MIHVAQMVATGKEKKEIYGYLKEQGYANSTDQLNKIKEDPDFQLWVDKAKIIVEAAAKQKPVETEEVTVRDGVAYVKQENTDSCVAHVKKEEKEVEKKPELPGMKLVRSVSYKGEFARYELNADGGVLIVFENMSGMKKFPSVTGALMFAREVAEAIRLIVEEIGT